MTIVFNVTWNSGGTGQVVGGWSIRQLPEQDLEVNGHF